MMGNLTHDMDVVLDYADQMIVIDDGKIKQIGKPKDILKDDVEQYNLETPNIYQAIHELRKLGKNISDNVHDIPSLIEELKHHG